MNLCGRLLLAAKNFSGRPKFPIRSEVMVPEPAGDLNIEHREGLSVVRLSRLIEMKIACGLGSTRRTHKDFADVVELIAIRNLDSSFARFLHQSLRKTFKELVRSAHSDG